MNIHQRLRVAIFFSFGFQVCELPVVCESSTPMSVGCATGDGSGGLCVLYGGVVSYTLGMADPGSSGLTPFNTGYNPPNEASKNTSMTS